MADPAARSPAEGPWRAGLVLVLALLAVPSGGLRAAAPNDAFVQPESTRRMIEVVRQIHAAADPLRNPFRSRDQLPQLRALAAGATELPARLEMQYRLAMHTLMAGDPAAALLELDALDVLMREHQHKPDDAFLNKVLTARATCHLRAGETANCVANHNADSCLFPIRGGGVHRLPEGSQAAKAVLLDLLARFPGDLRARWLLNIACMTLGEYPDKVPPRWLIPPERFASEHDIGRFPDVAGALGLDVDALAGGVVLEDFDRDGFLDVMVSSWGFDPGRDQLRVFRNAGDGTFTERTAPAGLTGIVSGLNLIHGDYDNDGFADVLLLRGAWFGPEGHYPLTLLRNNGDFTFTDVTERTGLSRHRQPTQTAVWFDYNGDGRLDLFVGNESTAGEANPCELFRNNGDGTFTECAAAHGVAVVAYVKGVASGDFNNDGRPDLFLSTREGSPKFLLRNDGPAGPDRSPAAPWRFTDVTEAAGIAESETRFGFPCWFWDYDNDGWEDLLMTGYAIQSAGDIAADYLGRPHAGHRARLYRNNGDGTFANVSRATGVGRLLHAMGANFGDLDNDGWLDFYVGTGDPDLTTLIPSRMFRNDGGRLFQDVTTSGGFGQLQKGHGIAFGDLDNDGDQDVYSVVGGAVEADNYPNQLFANPGHGNRWLKLELEGVRTNRVAIGARIKVVARDAGGARTICRTVGTGGSFGANPLRQEIGLGQATAVERVEIFWPVTGATQVVTGLEPDRCYRVVEGRTAAEAVTLRSFVLPGPAPAGAGHHHH